MSALRTAWLAPALPSARSGRAIPRPPSLRRACVVASAESGSGLTGWLGRAQAALPVVGLLTRLTQREGGVGSDRLYYSEYCVRQQRLLSPDARAALLEFEAAYGQMARPGVVMFWCWLASVGAGVVRREDVILSARRMRASLDMEYELMSIEQLLDDPDKREMATAAAAAVPVEAKARVAAEAIINCCVGQALTVDKPLLRTIMDGFFPGVEIDVLLLEGAS